MKAKTISSFATGLLVATGVSGAAYFFGPSEKASTQSEEPASVEEMKTLLTSEGYTILTEEEWGQEIAAAVEAVEKSKEAEPVEPKQDAPEEGKETIIYRTILNVASGMTSIDVGRALVQGKIIDDATTFYNEVEKRGLSNELRPGTFELDSNMTMDEVMTTIFK
ncbi:hypothetical protein SAMN05192533_11666 [Mesobacillus persicus]|uniref:YceG-like family protein n=1 Tax=Mesobacillus persicus TaxID=930146 RepID=A0A1H8I4Q8_9BACI|nr:hypothetical protein [Mesobacillus persicus]SEN63790.1 hypothetical protein SAMN05192533_11666 [Mesobacillus persicus]